MRLLESGSVAGCSARTALSRPTRILRAIIMARAICGCCCSRWEERSLCANLVRSLIHLGFHFWLTNWVSQLYNQVVVQVVFVWRLGLFSNARSNNLTLDSLSTS